MEFTVQEACEILDPPVTPAQLRELIRALDIPPVGRKRQGHRGRPVNTYDYAELARLHQVLVPFLASTPQLP